MGVGPGYLDPEGVYQFGEDDAETLMSDLLNLGQESVSTAFGSDRSRLDQLEAKLARLPYAVAIGIVNAPADSVGATVNYPAGRFTVAPVVALGAGHYTSTGNKGGGASIIYESPRSADHFKVAANGSAATTVFWVAVQMEGP
ncbi:MAG: hypothetical protein KF680_07190 [Cryobacterium sp.]|nr:hypothetical protein [Cryobacterium sp.]